MYSYVVDFTKQMVVDRSWKHQERSYKNPRLLVIA